MPGERNFPENPTRKCAADQKSRPSGRSRGRKIIGFQKTGIFPARHGLSEQYQGRILRAANPRRSFSELSPCWTGVRSASHDIFGNVKRPPDKRPRHLHRRPLGPCTEYSLWSHPAGDDRSGLSFAALCHATKAEAFFLKKGLRMESVAQDWPSLPASP